MLPLIFILKAYSKAPMFRKKERFWDTEVRGLKKRTGKFIIRGVKKGGYYVKANE